MSNITLPMVPSHSASTVLMGGYACAVTGDVFAGRKRTAIEHDPGTPVWSHTT